ncbi:exported hypothetical protein [Gammaproteobacteria bacterium]
MGMNKNILMLCLISVLITFCGTASANNNIYLKTEKDFNFVESEKKSSGTMEGFFAYSKDSTIKYLIKRTSNNEEIMNEITAAFILNKIIPNIAPMNYAVKMDDGSFAIASRFIKNFLPYSKYIGESIKHNDLIAQASDIGCIADDRGSFDELLQACDTDFIKELFFSPMAVESNLLASFINHKVWWTHCLDHFYNKSRNKFKIQNLTC